MRASRAAQYVVHGRDIGPPLLAPVREDPATLGREAIKTAIALAGLLDPAALEPPPALEPKQRRIQRGKGKGQPPARPRLNQLADVVAVSRPRLDERQHEHLNAALFQLGVEHTHPMSSDHPFARGVL